LDPYCGLSAGQLVLPLSFFLSASLFESLRENPPAFNAAGCCLAPNPALPPDRSRTNAGERSRIFSLRGRNATILHRLFIARSRRF